jgi:hypothetical protein
VQALREDIRELGRRGDSDEPHLAVLDDLVRKVLPDVIGLDIDIEWGSSVIGGHERAKPAGCQWAAHPEALRARISTPYTQEYKKSPFSIEASFTFQSSDQDSI